MNPVKISAISYLNTLPFLFGIKNSVYLKKNSCVELDIPSVCADKLINGNADIGIVPVAVLPQLKNYKIISDYCIGSTGNVRSVLLLSEQPINKIEKIILDFHSRSSIALVKILTEKYWKISPQWENGNPGFEKNIKDSTAGVIIGDRAMMLSSKFAYSYDLAGCWTKLTGLPFVFACWVAVTELNSEFLCEFNNALKHGIDNINSVITEYKNSSREKIDRIEDYYKKNVSYQLDDKKHEAMKIFLDYINVMQQ